MNSDLMKRYLLSIPILLIIILNIVFTEASLGDDASVVKSRLDEYRGKIDNHINFSNQTILSRIEANKGAEEINDVNQLQAFNINLEICKDLQVLLERYYIYLSWLSDLYEIKQNAHGGSIDSVINKEITILEDRTVASLDFEVNKYIPSFLPDISDQSINAFGRDVLNTLSDVKKYIESLKKTS